MCPFWSFSEFIWDLKADSPASWSHVSGSYSTSSCESEPEILQLSAAFCCLRWLERIRSVSRMVEKKKPENIQTVVDLLVPPAEAQPGRADRVRPDSSGDQWPAGRERSPAPRRYEPTSRRLRPAGCSCTCYVRHVSLTALTRITRRREEAAQRLVVFLQPQIRRGETTGQFQVFRFIYNRFCDDVKGVNKLKRVPRGLKSRLHRLC